MVKRTAGGSPSHVVVRSIAFTPATLSSLEALAAQIVTRTGRKASVSAVLRALVRHVSEIDEIAPKLAALVEREESNEIVWGKPPPRER